MQCPWLLGKRAAPELGAVRVIWAEPRDGEAAAGRASVGAPQNVLKLEEKHGPQALPIGGPARPHNVALFRRVGLERGRAL